MKQWKRRIKILTDHKNLAFDKAKSTHVRNWRLLLEDFNPVIEYLPGVENEEADTLSRYPMSEGPLSDDAVSKALLNYPTNVAHFPVSYDAIHQAQEADPDVLKLVDEQPTVYSVVREFGNFKLVCRKFRNDQWRIVLPNSLVDDTIDWYHIYLQHPGVTRMHATIGAYFYAPNLLKRIQEKIKRCGVCQRQKQVNTSYGHVPECSDYPRPFEQVCTTPEVRVYVEHNSLDSQAFCYCSSVHNEFIAPSVRVLHLTDEAPGSSPVEI